MTTGGEALVQTLSALGVRTLFGLPGVQNDYFYNAIYDMNAACAPEARLQVIHTRHEQGAGYMALGYALAGNRPGVFAVVPGPGFLNASAALATAYGLNARVFCLSGQLRRDQLGRGYGMLHEIPDQLGVMRRLTKWAERVRTPDEASRLVLAAFNAMLSDRPRPVALECPMDVFSGQTSQEPGPFSLAVRRPGVDPDRVREAAALLAKAKEPMILVGGGAQDAAEEVAVLAALLQAPVIATSNGRGVLSSRHYLSHTLPAGHRLWAKTDVVLAVGTRMTMPLLYWGVDEDLTIIRVDVDPEEHTRILSPDVSLVADSRDALRALIPEVEARIRPRASRRAEMMALRHEMETEFERLQPQVAFLRTIRDVLPENGIFVDELTQVGYVSRFAFPVYEPRTYLTPGYQGTLGWGFAAGLGAKVAQPHRTVVTVSGDGGFLFAAQELATAVQHQIATINIVFNDGAYGNVRRMQKEQYGGRVIASELHNPDFVAFAESFGALGLRATTPESLALAMEQALYQGGPAVIEVPVGEMPSPWQTIFMPRVRGRS